MSTIPQSKYIEPTQEAGRAFVARQLKGSVVMLNLVRFREVADYSAAPELTPSTPISGEEAYQRYIDHTLPYLHEAGAELIFQGKGGLFVIGPPDEEWDLVLLVRHRSVEAFLAFASHEGYLAGAGHRTAALSDSRLLPIIEEH